MASSLSSPPMLASSSLSPLSLSLPIIFTLPTELLTVLLSWASEPHALPGIIAGESSAIELTDILRDGMFMPFCVMTGEESGSRGGSATVEWCKFVQAREKSNPRECRGKDVAGLPDWLCNCIYEYMLAWSSCGLSGTVCESCAGLGICRLRPRVRNSGRRSDLGVVGTALSSFDSRRRFSWKEGLGASAVGGSERLRFLAGGFDGVVESSAGVNIDSTESIVPCLEHSIAVQAPCVPSRAYLSELCVSSLAMLLRLVGRLIQCCQRIVFVPLVRCYVQLLYLLEVVVSQASHIAVCSRPDPTPPRIGPRASINDLYC
jgi:hypothetical protein